MYLRGQGGRGAGREGGYAMAALLVTIALMGIVLSVAMPVWRHDGQREKEAELVFRGQQYVRAIRLYNMKTSSLPPSVDVLVQGRYIRKKFKDPITGEDFEIIGAGSPQQQPGVPGQPGQAGQISQPSPGSSAFTSASGAAAPGGVIGVRSKSKDESIRIYQGRTHYNEWAFVYVQQQPGRGGFPGGAGGPGGIGGRGGRGGDGRGGRGGDGTFTPGRPGGPGRGGPGGPPTFPGRPGGGRG